MGQSPHIAFFPSPGMGHLIPLTEFAKRLVQHHNFSVTIIVPTTGAPPVAQKAFLEALPKSIHYDVLPPVSLEDLPKDVKPELQIFLTVYRSLSYLRDTLRSLSNLVALVMDFFGTDALDVAKEFQISPYLFFPMPGMSLSLSFSLPKLDEMTSCEYRDLPDPVEIPGSVPVHGRDLFEPIQDRSSVVYKGFLQFCTRLNLMEGVLLNSFLELEEEAIGALRVGEPGRPKIYPIGPLIQTGSNNGSASNNGSEQHECLQWLDNQPSGSVLFVSFGSGGTLSFNQLNELVFGLEMSGQRFLWVFRAPNEKASTASFFGDQSQNDPLAFLPKGFLDRTKERGLVVPSWVPQVEVLSHGSTGGFLTHCGWNSILESVIHGVPLIAWPLYAEQKMNAIMLTEVLNVAIRAKVGENGVVRREEIGKIVKGLMEDEEGKKIGKRMNELKDTARKVLSSGGSSMESLSMFASQWKNQKST